MPDTELRAVVVGAGWAGEGHTKALQSTGVTVEAICARSPRVVDQVAKNLGVPVASTDWETTVRDIRPDIVAVATPARVRREVIEVACEIESHLLCDKPLGVSTNDALEYYKCVRSAGVKHAYAATHRYDPSVTWAARLLREGVIGSLTEMDFVLIAPFIKATTPWSWNDVLADGGGMLNNALPHFLGMIETIVDGKVTWATGEARVLRESAPFVPDLHDWRQVMGAELTEEEAGKLECKECDADGAFSALLKVDGPQTRGGQKLTVGVRINLSSPVSSPANGWYLIGDEGALVGDGVFSMEITKRDGEAIEELPIPDALIEAMPEEDSDVQQKWSALAQNFVADVRGQKHTPYLTFRDGWRYQAIADAIRSRSAREIPADV